jgi:hypothetical protein
MQIRKEIVSAYSKLFAKIDFVDFAVEIPILPKGKEDELYIYQPTLLLGEKEYEYTSKDTKEIRYTIEPEEDELIFVDDKLIVKPTTISVQPHEAKHVIKFISTVPYHSSNDLRLKVKAKVWYLSDISGSTDYIILMPLEKGNFPIYMVSPNMKVGENIVKIFNKNTSLILYNTYDIDEDK